MTTGQRGLAGGGLTIGMTTTGLAELTADSTERRHRGGRAGDSHRDRGRGSRRSSASSRDYSEI